MHKIIDHFVKVGVSVFILQDRQILLARRKNQHGRNCWDTPGGHLEFNESVKNCALRETLEETGLHLEPKRYIELGFTEDYFELTNKHYVSCVVCCVVDNLSLLPAITEIDKFSTPWEWWDLCSLPQPLFLPVQNAIDKFQRQLLRAEVEEI